MLCDGAGATCHGLSVYRCVDGREGDREHAMIRVLISEFIVGSAFPSLLCVAQRSKPWSDGTVVPPVFSWRQAL